MARRSEQEIPPLAFVTKYRIKGGAWKRIRQEFSARQASRGGCGDRCSGVLEDVNALSLLQYRRLSIGRRIVGAVIDPHFAQPSGWNTLLASSNTVTVPEAM